MITTIYVFWHNGSEYFLETENQGNHIYNSKKKTIQKTSLKYHEYCKLKGVTVLSRIGFKTVEEFCGKDVKFLKKEYNG